MGQHASLNIFVVMTQRVIAKDGFDGYLPTFVLPARRHVAVLEGVPEHVDVAVAARRWAEDMAGPDDFLLAYKLDSGHFQAIKRTAGAIEERVVAIARREPNNGARLEP